LYPQRRQRLAPRPRKGALAMRPSRAVVGVLGATVVGAPLFIRGAHRTRPPSTAASIPKDDLP
jgi:hypothetical protein